MSLCLISTCILAGFASFFRPVQQFLNSRFILLGAVKPEIELRCAPNSQSLYKFVANVFLRGFEALETVIGFSIIAFDIDPDLGRAAIIGHVNCRHANQSDARVREFSFHQGFDLFAKGFADPTSMMLEPTLLQDFTSGKTVENIRKKVARVAPDTAIVHRFGRSPVSTTVTAA
jgi:hypothetical protein